MKFSRYNIKIEQNDKYIVFNSLSGRLIRLLKSDYSENNPDLKDKGFVVNKNDDEIARYKYLFYSGVFSKSYLNLTIATTLACNLKCPYCFEEGNKSKTIMKKDVEDAIVKYIISQKKRKIGITWFGGEPLLNASTIKNITSQLKDYKITFESTIITNGTLFSDANVQMLDENEIKLVQITLDGTKESHNRKRFFANGKGTFDLILSNIESILTKTKSQLILKTNLDKENIKEYVDLRRFLYNKFKQYIIKNRLILTENYVRNRTNFSGCNKCLSKEENFEYQHSVLKRPYEIPSPVGACPLRSTNSFIIGPSGEIYKCMEHLGDNTKSIGNIITHSYRIQDVANCVFKYSPFDDNDCVNCEILPICGGGCPIDREKKLDKTKICSVVKERIYEILINSKL